MRRLGPSSTVQCSRYHCNWAGYAIWDNEVRARVGRGIPARQQPGIFGATGARSIGELLNQHALSLLAISVGAVFFGAATYIGNGPNFMVKAVADQEKIRMPTFPGFVLKFTLPFLLPMLLAVWLIFFRG